MSQSSVSAIGCAILLFAASHAARAMDPSWPALPQSVASHGAIVSDGWLYVYGGHTGKTHDYSTESVSGKFSRLKLDGGTTWEDLPGGPALQGMNLAVDRGRVYRVGGMQPRNKPGDPADNHSVADAAVFDPTAGRWEPLPPLPEPRSSHDVVVLDGKLYVVGGWIMHGANQKQTWPSSAFVLDLAHPNAGWKALTQPFQRRALTAAAAGGKLYVLGGLTESADAVQEVDVFDPHTGKWSKGPEYPGNGVGFSPAACAVNGRLCLSTSDGKLHRLNAAGDAWEPAGALTIPRIVHRLVPFGNEAVLAIGGASRKGDARRVELATLAAQKVKAAP